MIVILNRQLTLWGTGSPRREFLYVDDLADAVLFLMNNYDEQDPVNIGSGSDLSIFDLAQLVKDVVGFEGQITWNTDMPDGTPRKLLDVSRLAKMGWNPSTQLREGIEMAHADFLNRQEFLND